MRRSKRKNGAAAAVAQSALVNFGLSSSPKSAKKEKATWLDALTKPRGKANDVTHIKAKDLTFILRYVAILMDNGVALPKALTTLSKEKHLEQYTQMLDTIRRKVESGESFSRALAKYPETFDLLMINQIKVGERSGSMAETLDRIATQREQQGQLKSQVIKKLAYPGMLIVLGSGVITFMLMYVVPTFQDTYDSAGIPLPMITQVLIDTSALAKAYGWMLAVALIITVVTIKRLRKKPAFAKKMDGFILKLPLAGNLLRDIAVLQLMEVLGNLMEAGFTLAEALGEAAGSIGNRAVRGSVVSLQSAVLRGEKFSREIERHGEMFPPIVSQLVIVGEQTGMLVKSTAHIREHLNREIERKTGVMVGTIEPVLTVCLAAAIAVILLAIYLPMFDMIGSTG